MELILWLKTVAHLLFVVRLSEWTRHNYLFLISRIARIIYCHGIYIARKIIHDMLTWRGKYLQDVFTLYEFILRGYSANAGIMALNTFLTNDEHFTILIWLKSDGFTCQGRFKLVKTVTTKGTNPLFLPTKDY